MTSHHRRTRRNCSVRQQDARSAVGVAVGVRVLLTWHKAFSEWCAITGDDLLATAILEWLLHHCDVLSINGPS